MAKTHSHLLKGLPECIPSTDIPLFQQWKGGARKWIHCAQSAFARKVFILYSKTYNKGRNTVISAWTSASKVWIVLRWAIEITCPVVCVWCLPDEGWECTIITPFTIWTWVNKVMLTWYVKNSVSSNNGAIMYLLLLNYYFFSSPNSNW